MAAGNAIVTAIFAIFTAVLDWFGTALATVSAIFYADGALTFIGTVCLVGLAIAVVVMLIAMLRSLIKGRG